MPVKLRGESPLGERKEREGREAGGEKSEFKGEGIKDGAAGLFSA